MPSSNCSDDAGVVDAGVSCESIADSMTAGEAPVLSCPADNTDGTMIASFTGTFPKIAYKVCGISALLDTNDAQHQYTSVLSFGPAIKDGAINEVGITNYNIWLVDETNTKIGLSPVATVPASTGDNVYHGACCHDEHYTTTVTLDLSAHSTAHKFMIVPNSLPAGTVSGSITDVYTDSEGDGDDDESVAVKTITGAFSFDLGTSVNITIPEVEVASKKSLASALTVDMSRIDVTVTAARRLEKLAQLRKLGGSYNVAYSIEVSEDQLSTVLSSANDINSNSTAFQSVLVTEIADVLDIDVAIIASALTISSFDPPVTGAQVNSDDAFRICSWSTFVAVIIAGVTIVAGN